MSHHQIDWLKPGWRFGDYGVRQIGWRYEVACESSDGIVRKVYVGPFWRWLSAARVAQALWSAQIKGCQLGLKGDGPHDAMGHFHAADYDQEVL